MFTHSVPFRYHEVAMVIAYSWLDIALSFGNM